MPIDSSECHVTGYGNGIPPTGLPLGWQYTIEKIIGGGEGTDGIVPKVPCTARLGESLVLASRSLHSTARQEEWHRIL